MHFNQSIKVLCIQVTEGLSANEHWLQCQLGCSLTEEVFSHHGFVVVSQSRVLPLDTSLDLAMELLRVKKSNKWLIVPHQERVELEYAVKRESLTILHAVKCEHLAVFNNLDILDYMTVSRQGELRDCDSFGFSGVKSGNSCG